MMIQMMMAAAVRKKARKVMNLNKRKKIQSLRLEMHTN